MVCLIPNLSNIKIGIHVGICGILKKLLRLAWLVCVFSLWKKNDVSKRHRLFFRCVSLSHTLMHGLRSRLAGWHRPSAGTEPPAKRQRGAAPVPRGCWQPEPWALTPGCWHSFGTANAARCPNPQRCSGVVVVVAVEESQRPTLLVGLTGTR